LERERFKKGGKRKKRNKGAWKMENGKIEKLKNR
jgi:hypothetical protein